MSIDEAGKQAALRAAFDVGTITVKDTLKILEAYETAKTDQPDEKPVYAGRGHALYLTQKAKAFLAGQEAQVEKKLGQDIYDEIFDAWLTKLVGDQSVQAHCQRLADKIMKHIAYHLRPSERESGWHTISTAPKDRLIFTYAKEHGGNIMLVKWSDRQQYWVDPYSDKAFEWGCWAEANIPILPEIEGQS